MQTIKTILRTAVFASTCVVASSQAAVITYNDFSSTAGLTMVGSATKESTSDGAVLRLTPDVGNRAGAAFSSSGLQLGSNATFSTSFQFRISHGPATPADGLAFVLAASPSGLGTLGSGIGYQGVNKSFAIEFDTYNNGFYDGYGNNHVAVSANGTWNTSTPVDVYGTKTCSGANVAGCMSNGHLWTATIGYDGAHLSVKLLDEALGTSFVALENYAIDIASILGTNQAYAGFTSATGALSSNHDILNWTFADTPKLPQDVPEPASAWIIGLGLAGMAAGKRAKRKA